MLSALGPAYCREPCQGAELESAVGEVDLLPPVGRVPVENIVIGADKYLFPGVSQLPQGFLYVRYGAGVAVGGDTQVYGRLDAMIANAPEHRGKMLFIVLPVGPVPRGPRLGTALDPEQVGYGEAAGPGLPDGVRNALMQVAAFRPLVDGRCAHAHGDENDAVIQAMPDEEIPQARPYAAAVPGRSQERIGGPVAAAVEEIVHGPAGDVERFAVVPRIGLSEHQGRHRPPSPDLPAGNCNAAGRVAKADAQRHEALLDEHDLRKRRQAVLVGQEAVEIGEGDGR